MIIDSEIDIKMTIFCAQSFDTFTKDVLDKNPINLDLREDGNAASVNESAAMLTDLILGGKDFTAITVHDTALNFIGLLIAENILKRDNVTIKYYDENTGELVTASYDNGGYICNWPIGYLSAWDYKLSRKLYDKINQLV